MSDEEMIKLLRQKKATLEKRIEIASFLHDLLLEIKGDK